MPPEHPWHGVGYDNVRMDDEEEADSYVQVHGGLTFADKCQKSINPSAGVCHVQESGDERNIWWLGFDCAHCYDVMPAMAALTSPMTALMTAPSFGDFTDTVYRDLDYVKNECAGLAVQAASVQP